MKQNKTLQAARTAANETAGKILLEKVNAAWAAYELANKEQRYKDAREHEANYYEFLLQLQKFPYVGLPCTVFYYSDKRAGQIVDIKGNKFQVQALKYKDTNQGECEVLDELDTRMLGWYSFRKCGKAYQVGSPAKYGNVTCVLGFKSTYIDPNF